MFYSNLLIRFEFVTHQIFIVLVKLVILVLFRDKIFLLDFVTKTEVIHLLISLGTRLQLGENVFYLKRNLTSGVPSIQDHERFHGGTKYVKFYN